MSRTVVYPSKYGRTRSIDVAAHPISAYMAAAICQDLHNRKDLDLAVQIVHRVIHLYPERPFTASEEVTALAAFIRVTDGRLAWHARRPDAGWHA